MNFDILSLGLDDFKQYAILILLLIAPNLFLTDLFKNGMKN